MVDFSLLDRVILSVDNLTNAHNVCDYNNKYWIWWLKPKSPNHKIKITAKCTT